MDYLKRVLDDLYSQEKRMGRRDQCVINTEALTLLVRDYERLDALARIQYNKEDPNIPLMMTLHDTLVGLYSSRSNSEDLIFDILEILKPLIKKRRKENEINAIYRR